MSIAPWVCFRCLQRCLPLTRFAPLSQRRSYSSGVPDDKSLSPALLARARILSDEHIALTKRQAETFDSKTAKRIGELAAAANALQSWDKAKEALAELNSMLADASTDPELRSLALEDLESTKASLLTTSNKIKEALIPKHPFDELPCLVEIRPGAGGDEASIFTSEVLRMYLAFCARTGLKATILKKDKEDGGGAAGSDDRVSEAVLEVDTPGSYGILRTEVGVHRVQRVPATETKGRTHTSAVSVMILPSLPISQSGDSPLNFENPNSDYYINPQEVISEKMRAGGAGGQHVNKTESAIRLTHVPTKTVVSMQDSRSQHDNRRKAWQLLRARLAQRRREAREKELVELRRGAMGGVSKMGREDKIRTYNFGQSRCTDHRTGMTIHSLGKVLDGGDGLEKLMESVKNWLVDQEVEMLYVEEQSKLEKPNKRR